MRIAQGLGGLLGIRRCADVCLNKKFPVTRNVTLNIRDNPYKDETIAFDWFSLFCRPKGLASQPPFER